MSNALALEKAAKKSIEDRITNLEERVTKIENVPVLPSIDDLDAVALEQSVKDATEDTATD